jgi:hypothetical protein
LLEFLMFDGPNPIFSETPAAIAAAVRRSRAHEAAELALTTAKERRSLIAHEIGAISARRTDRTLLATNDAVAALSAEDEKIASGMQALRAAALAGRAAHSRAIRIALTPTIIDVAARGHQAFLAACEALDVLEQCSAAVQQAGGEPLFIPAPSGLRPAAARLARLAGHG